MMAGMWARALVAATVALAGCGRVGFRALADGARAPGSDASGDGTAPCSALHELCEDFEETQLDTQVWTQVVPIASIDTTRAHTGSASLHVQTPAFSSGGVASAFIGERKTPLLEGSPFYVRVWTYLEAQPVNNMSYVTASTTADLEDGFFIEDGNVSIYTQFANNNVDTITPAPLGTWFCALWTVTPDAGSGGSMYLSGDAGSLMLTDLPTDGSPGLSELEFGINFSTSTDGTPQPLLDLWIDDIIVDKAPLTCEEPSS
jgi:hypothetical protein